MAVYTAVENTPIVVNMLIAAQDTGWSLPGDGTADHVVCNPGYLTLLNYPVIAGHQYTLAYTITAINTGYVQGFAGTTGGTQHTTPGVIVETITAASGGSIQFYSNANCTITLFSIKDVTIVDPLTIVYSATNKKWSDFRTIYPDFGWSQFENTITAKDGQLYFHENGTNNTNEFYGIPYQSILQVVFAKNATIIKSYDVLSYQCNMLLVSTQGGITTSLGQKTTLINSDFVKAKLSDGVTSTTIYQYDNVYSASFWNDEAGDVVNGDPLRGNYIVVELVTVYGSSIMEIFSVSVKQSRSFIGNR